MFNTPQFYGIIPQIVGLLWVNISTLSRIVVPHCLTRGKQMNKTLLTVLCATMLGVAMPAFAQKPTDIRAVGAAKWQAQKRVDVMALAEQEIQHGEASIFFVREMDADTPQTSVNIAVNRRFQVSLQPGRFSQVVSCSGINELSANITGHKKNDLLSNTKRFELQSRGTYFFFVEVDENGNSNISPLSHDYALQYILDNEMKYQAHQLSRVKKQDCVEPLTVDAPPPLMPEMTSGVVPEVTLKVTPEAVSETPPETPVSETSTTETTLPEVSENEAQTIEPALPDKAPVETQVNEVQTETQIDTEINETQTTEPTTTP